MWLRPSLKQNYFHFFTLERIKNIDGGGFTAVMYLSNSFDATDLKFVGEPLKVVIR